MPASSQGLPTSVVRWAVPPHWVHWMSMRSTQGRWGLWPWNASHPAPPKPWSEADAAEFLALAKQNHGDEVSSDEKYVTQFAKICAGELNPMCAAVGGVVAQEVKEMTRMRNARITDCGY